MASTSQHPGPQVLAAFALGKTTSDQARMVMNHLQTCSICKQFLDTTSSEEMLALLQDNTGTQQEKPEQIQRKQKSEIPSELRNQKTYQNLRVLGRGGMGIVFYAEQPLMDRKVALKVINQEFVHNPEALDRFRREIIAAGKLNHPNIVRAYHAEELGSLLLLVLEYVEGKDLNRLVTEQEKFKIDTSIQYLIQTCQGLQHAHEKGMVHRDIKPHNLMLSSDGVIKILDFGLARFVSEQKQNVGLTGTRQVFGTPVYMSPDQAHSARKADIRADIYSLGCTFYHLLTGDPPFDGETFSELMIKHLTEPPRPIQELRPTIPDHLAKLIGDMLAKSPEQRPQTPQAIIDRLQRNGSVPIPSSVKIPKIEASEMDQTFVDPDQLPDTVLVAKQPVDKLRSPKPIYLVLGGLAVFLFASLILLLLWNKTPPETTLAQTTSESKTEPVIPKKDATKKLSAKKVDLVPPKILPDIPTLANRQPGDTIAVEMGERSGKRVQMLLCWVPAGKFMMGSPNTESKRSDDEELREVQIAQGFFLGKYEVTQAEYEAVTGVNPARMQPQDDRIKKDKILDTRNYPVENVSWEMATAYCDLLNQKYRNKGYQFALPTETQWEYACRGGLPNQNPFYFGTELNGEQANCNGQEPYGTMIQGPRLGRISEVGSYEKSYPHPWGFCDMHGNLWEWCQDWYDTDQEKRVMRGGSWDHPAHHCRSAIRNRSMPNYQTMSVGFRISLRVD